MTADIDEEYTLLRILPEQVSEGWNSIAPLIELSLPPTVSTKRLRMANILRAILMDELEVWLVKERSSNQEKIILSTLVRTDPISLSKDLVIYSFTSIGHLGVSDIPMVRQLFQKFKRYAQSRGCLCITAYVDDVKVKDFLQSLGASTHFNLIQIEV